MRFVSKGHSSGDAKGHGCFHPAVRCVGATMGMKVPRSMILAKAKWHI